VVALSELSPPSNGSRGFLQKVCRRRPVENTEQEAGDVKAGDCKKDFHPVVRLPQKKEVTKRRLIF